MVSNGLREILYQRRRERRLTLKRLGTESGVSASHLGRIERGERLPAAPILRKLAEPLGFSETELLKIAGYLSRDDSDERVEKLKEEIKAEVTQALITIHQKIDRL